MEKKIYICSQMAGSSMQTSHLVTIENSNKLTAWFISLTDHLIGL